MPEPFTSLARRSLRIYLEGGLREAAEPARIIWIRRLDECSARIKSYVVSAGFNVEELASGPGEAGHGSLAFTLHEGEEALLVDSAVVDTGRLQSLVESAVDVIAVEEPARVGCGSVFVGSRRLEADYVVAAMGPWTPLPRRLRGNVSVYLCELLVMRRGGEGTGAPEPLIDDSLDFYLLARGSEAVAGDGLYRELRGFPATSPSPDPESYGKVINALTERIIGSERWVLWDVLAAPCASCLDTGPIVGPHPDCRRLLLFTGLDGVGVTLAPALAEILADHVHSGSPEPFFSSPSRQVRDVGVRPPEPFRLCESPWQGRREALGG
jgi:hypothetical protein